MKKTLLTLFFFVVTVYLFAQDTAATEMEREGTGMRANEKIYVVLAVLGTILAGFFVYLIRLDGKIGKLEREGRDVNRKSSIVNRQS